jgi:hypothetical protein
MSPDAAAASASDEMLDPTEPAEKADPDAPVEATLPDNPAFPVGPPALAPMDALVPDVESCPLLAPPVLSPLSPSAVPPPLPLSTVLKPADDGPGPRVTATGPEEKLQAGKHSAPRAPRTTQRMPHT